MVIVSWRPVGDNFFTLRQNVSSSALMNLKPFFVLLKSSVKLLVRYRDMYIKKGTWTKDTAVLARLSEVCSLPGRIDSMRE